MEKQDMRVLTLDPYQHGVVINALNNLRNDLIEDKRPTDIMRWVRRWAVRSSALRRAAPTISTPWTWWRATATAATR